MHLLDQHLAHLGVDAKTVHGHVTRDGDKFLLDNLHDLRALLEEWLEEGNAENFFHHALLQRHSFLGPDEQVHFADAGNRAQELLEEDLADEASDARHKDHLVAEELAHLKRRHGSRVHLFLRAHWMIAFLLAWFKLIKQNDGIGVFICR